MDVRRIKPRSAALLGFALLSVAAASTLAVNEAGAARRLLAGRTKSCYYAGEIYTTGACRGGQRCVTGVGDVDYWQDDSNCPQTSPGSGGRPQV